MLTFRGACPFFLSCLLQLNFVKNSIVNLMTTSKTIACVARNTSYEKELF